MPAIEMTPESSTTGRFRNRPLVMFRSAFAPQDRQQRRPGREVTDRGNGGLRSLAVIADKRRSDTNAGPPVRTICRKAVRAVAAATTVCRPAPPALSAPPASPDPFSHPSCPDLTIARTARPTSRTRRANMRRLVYPTPRRADQPVCVPAPRSPSSARHGRHPGRRRLARRSAVPDRCRRLRLAIIWGKLRGRWQSGR
jgi:hypothetical protein